MIVRIFLSRKQLFQSDHILQRSNANWMKVKMQDREERLVYKFECDLCDAGYVDFTRRYLHRRDLPQPVEKLFLIHQLATIFATNIF